MDPPIGEVKAVGRGRGFWRRDQPVAEPRRPQNVSSPLCSAADTFTSSGDAVSSEVRPVVILSAEAKEFVPRGFTFTNTQSNNLQALESSLESCELNGQEEETSSYDSSHEWLFELLNGIIKSLVDSPGHFDMYIESLLSELQPMLAYEEVMEKMIMIITDQAITERNFRYNGARLCNALNIHARSQNNSHFQRILLNKLSEEHDKIESNVENNPERVYGFVHFLGELFTQLEIPGGPRIAVIGDALVLALKLLVQIPLIDNIKNTCDVLKLVGRFLDQDQGDVMASFFNDFQELLEDERVGVRGRAMISNILRLRDENWGHKSTENSSMSSASSHNETNLWTNDGIYYGPDHEALTADEYKFLNDSCERDEVVSVGDDGAVWDPNVDENENSEIMAAFREFVNQKT